MNPSPPPPRSIKGAAIARRVRLPPATNGGMTLLDAGYGAGSFEPSPARNVSPRLVPPGDVLSKKPPPLPPISSSPPVKMPSQVSTNMPSKWKPEVSRPHMSGLQQPNLGLLKGVTRSLSPQARAGGSEVLQNRRLRSVSPKMKLISPDQMGFCTHAASSLSLEKRIDVPIAQSERRKPNELPIAAELPHLTAFLEDKTPECVSIAPHGRPIHNLRHRHYRPVGHRRVPHGNDESGHPQVHTQQLHLPVSSPENIDRDRSRYVHLNEGPPHLGEKHYDRREANSAGTPSSLELCGANVPWVLGRGPRVQIQQPYPLRRREADKTSVNRRLMSCKSGLSRLARRILTSDIAGHEGFRRLASELTAKCGSLRRAYTYFDVSNSKKMTRNQWQTGMALLRIDVVSILGVQPRKAFGWIDTGKKGVISVNTFMGFFSKVWGGPAAIHEEDEEDEEDDEEEGEAIKQLRWKARSAKAPYFNSNWKKSQHVGSVSHNANKLFLKGEPLAQLQEAILNADPAAAEEAEALAGALVEQGMVQTEDDVKRAEEELHAAKASGDPTRIAEAQTKLRNVKTLASWSKMRQYRRSLNADNEEGSPALKQAKEVAARAIEEAAELAQQELVRAVEMGDAPKVSAAHRLIRSNNQIACDQALLELEHATINKDAVFTKAAMEKAAATAQQLADGALLEMEHAVLLSPSAKKAKASRHLRLLSDIEAQVQDIDNKIAKPVASGRPNSAAVDALRREKAKLVNEMHMQVQGKGAGPNSAKVAGLPKEKAKLQNGVQVKTVGGSSHHFSLPADLEAKVQHIDTKISKVMARDGPNSTALAVLQREKAKLWDDLQVKASQCFRLPRIIDMQMQDIETKLSRAIASEGPNSAPVAALKREKAKLWDDAQWKTLGESSRHFRLPPDLEAKVQHIDAKIIKAIAIEGRNSAAVASLQREKAKLYDDLQASHDFRLPAVIELQLEDIDTKIGKAIASEGCDSAAVATLEREKTKLLDDLLAKVPRDFRLPAVIEMQLKDIDTKISKALASEGPNSATVAALQREKLKLWDDLLAKAPRHFRLPAVIEMQLQDIDTKISKAIAREGRNSTAVAALQREKAKLWDDLAVKGSNHFRLPADIEARVQEIDAKISEAITSSGPNSAAVAALQREKAKLWDEVRAKASNRFCLPGNIEAQLQDIDAKIGEAVASDGPNSEAVAALQREKAKLWDEVEAQASNSFCLPADIEAQVQVIDAKISNAIASDGPNSEAVAALQREKAELWDEVQAQASNSFCLPADIEAQVQVIDAKISNAVASDGPNSEAVAALQREKAKLWDEVQAQASNSFCLPADIEAQVQVIDAKISNAVASDGPNSEAVGALQREKAKLWDEVQAQASSSFCLPADIEAQVQVIDAKISNAVTSDGPNSEAVAALQREKAKLWDEVQASEQLHLQADIQAQVQDIDKNIAKAIDSDGPNSASVDTLQKEKAKILDEVRVKASQQFHLPTDIKAQVQETDKKIAEAITNDGPNSAAVHTLQREKAKLLDEVRAKASKQLRLPTDIQAQAQDIDKNIAMAVASDGPNSAAVDALQKEKAKLLDEVRVKASKKLHLPTNIQAQVQDIDKNIAEAIASDSPNSAAVDTLQKEKAKLLDEVRAKASQKFHLPTDIQAQVQDMDKNIAEAIASDGPNSAAVDVLQREKAKLLDEVRAKASEQFHLPTDIQAQVEEIDKNIAEAITSDGPNSAAVDALQSQKAKLLDEVRAKASEQFHLPTNIQVQVQDIDKNIADAIASGGPNSAAVDTLQREKAKLLDDVRTKAAQQFRLPTDIEAQVQEIDKNIAEAITRDGPSSAAVESLESEKAKLLDEDINGISTINDDSSVVNAIIKNIKDIKSFKDIKDMENIIGQLSELSSKIDAGEEAQNLQAACVALQDSLENGAEAAMRALQLVLPSGEQELVESAQAQVAASMQLVVEAATEMEKAQVAACMQSGEDPGPDANEASKLGNETSDEPMPVRAARERVRKATRFAAEAAVRELQLVSCAGDESSCAAAQNRVDVYAQRVVAEANKELELATASGDETRVSAARRSVHQSLHVAANAALAEARVVLNGQGGAQGNGTPKAKEAALDKVKKALARVEEAADDSVAQFEETSEAANLMAAGDPEAIENEHDLALKSAELLAEGAMLDLSVAAQSGDAARVAAAQDKASQMMERLADASERRLEFAEGSGDERCLARAQAVVASCRTEASEAAREAVRLAEIGGDAECIAAARKWAEHAATQAHENVHETASDSTSSDDDNTGSSSSSSESGEDGVEEILEGVEEDEQDKAGVRPTATSKLKADGAPNGGVQDASGRKASKSKHKRGKEKKPAEPEPKEPEIDLAAMEKQLEEEVLSLDISGVEALAYVLSSKLGSYQKAFHWFDVNKKRRIPRSQWDTGLALLRVNMEKLTGLRARQVFAILDRKHRGVVSKKDWHHFFQRLQEGNSTYYYMRQKHAKDKKKKRRRGKNRSDEEGEWEDDERSKNLPNKTSGKNRINRTGTPDGKADGDREAGATSINANGTQRSRNSTTEYELDRKRRHGEDTHGAHSDAEDGAKGGQRGGAMKNGTPNGTVRSGDGEMDGRGAGRRHGRGKATGDSDEGDSAEEGAGGRKRKNGRAGSRDATVGSKDTRVGSKDTRTSSRDTHSRAASRKDARSPYGKNDTPEMRAYRDAIREQLKRLKLGESTEFFLEPDEDWKRQIIQEVAEELYLWSCNQVGHEPRASCLFVAHVQDFAKQTEVQLRAIEPGESHEFPVKLSETQRRVVHLLAGKLGLWTRSEGKNQDRRVVAFNVGGLADEVRNTLQNLKPGESMTFPGNYSAAQRRVVHSIAAELSMQSKNLRDQNTGKMYVEVVNLAEFADKVHSALRHLAEGEEHTFDSDLTESQRRIIQGVASELDLSVLTSGDKQMTIANLAAFRGRVRAELSQLKRGEIKTFEKNLTALQRKVVLDIAAELKLLSLVTNDEDGGTLVEVAKPNADGSDPFAIRKGGSGNSDGDEDSKDKDEDNDGELSMIAQLFDAYATGMYKGKKCFLRFPDLAEFAEDMKSAMPAKYKLFRKFLNTLENLFDDTQQLQIDMGVRTNKGLTYDFFQVFIQKTIRKIGYGIVSLLTSMLDRAAV